MSTTNKQNNEHHHILSEESIKTYNSSLKKMAKLNIECDENNLFNVNDIIQKFNDNDIKLSTQKTLLASYVWKLKQTDNVSETYIDKIKQTIHNLRKQINAITEQNILSASERKNYLPFDTIMRIYNEIEKKYNETNKFDDLTDLLLIGLYVLQAPRRIKDYALLTLGNDKTKQNDKLNYYIRTKNKDGHFIFNNFKANKIQQKILIEKKELIDIIEKYINIFDINVGDSFFHFSISQFTRKLQSIFMKYSQKKISVDLIRHAYITYMVDEKKIITKRQRRELAEKMGHSVDVQLDYYKLPDESYNPVKIISSSELNEKELIDIKNKEDEKQKRIEKKKQQIKEWKEKNKEIISLYNKEQYLIRKKQKELKK